MLIMLNAVVTLAEVHELNKESLEKFRKGKLLIVIFVDSPTCTRCRIQYPFFVATSQAFPSDPEIFFARVHDTRLVQEWGIGELPALVYYRDGIDEPDFLLSDVTVDDITDEIARRLHGNFGGLERFYAVEVTSRNFREIVKTPKQDVLLVTYDKNTLQQMQVMEQVAKLFHNDDAILICKLNVDKEKELRDSEFTSRDVPVVYWYSADDKETPKRFGGNISIFMQTTFINEKTGLNRNPDGSMQPTSGRVEQFDNHVVDYADDILKVNKEAMARLISLLLIEKPKLRRHETEFSSYYVFLLDKILASGKMDVVETQLTDIVSKLEEHQDLLPKQEDVLKRKRNILMFFKDLPAEVVHRKEAERKKKEQERLVKEKQEKAEEQRRKKEEADEKMKEKKKMPGKRKTAPTAEFTAKATIHRRTHEEL